MQFVHEYLQDFNYDKKVGFEWTPTRLCRKSMHPFKFPVQKGKYNRYVIFLNDFASKSEKEFDDFRDIGMEGKIEPDRVNLVDLIVDAEEIAQRRNMYDLGANCDSIDVEGILVYRI